MLTAFLRSFVPPPEAEMNRRPTKIRPFPILGEERNNFKKEKGTTSLTYTGCFADIEQSNSQAKHDSGITLKPPGPDEAPILPMFIPTTCTHPDLQVRPSSFLGVFPLMAQREWAGIELTVPVAVS